MSLKAQLFNIRYDDLQKVIDVDDSAGRSVPKNMNFVDEGFLTKDTGFEYLGTKNAGLVAHYKFNGNSNDEVLGNNGTDTDITYTSGKIGQGASFNGTTSNIVIPDNESIKIKDEMSFSFWFKTDTVASNGVILAKINEYLIRRDGDKIHYRLYGGTDWGSSIHSTTITADTLYHIVCTHSITGGVATKKIYLNAVKTGENTQTGTFSSTTNNLTLGIWPPGEPFDGVIDELSVWNRALTQEEITLLYNNGNGTEDLSVIKVSDLDGTKKHSIFNYKRKDGTSMKIRARGGSLQKLNSDEIWEDIKSGDVTVTIASPAVATLNNHGLKAGSPVRFTTTGSLPTGMTVGTTYYVIATGLTANAFQFSTSVGGSAVNTSGTQSGTHSIYRVYTSGEEFGWLVYDDDLYGCNAVENYFKFDGTLFTEYSDAPKGNNLEVFEDRMFISGVKAEPMTLYYSNVGDPTVFGGTDLVKPLGTDSIVSQKNYYGSLIIFKKESIWKLTFIYEQVLAAFVPKLELQSGNYGACSRKAVSWVENSLWFFTGREVRSLSFLDQISGVFGVNKSVISENIKETLNRISIDNYDKVVVAYNNRRFYLGVPLDENTVDTVFVCHLLYGNNWTKYIGRAKAQVNDFMVIDDDLYTTRSSGTFGVLKWNSTLNDVDTAIASEVFFQRIEDKDFNKFRIFRYLGLMFKNLSATVTVTIRQEANDLISERQRTFFVGNLEGSGESTLGETIFGEVLWSGSDFGADADVNAPFIKKKVSFLSKNQALIIGLSNAEFGETFSIAKFGLSGKEQPRKLFDPSKIISVD